MTIQVTKGALILEALVKLVVARIAKVKRESFVLIHIKFQIRLKRWNDFFI